MDQNVGITITAREQGLSQLVDLLKKSGEGVQNIGQLSQLNEVYSHMADSVYQMRKVRDDAKRELKQEQTQQQQTSQQRESDTRRLANMPGDVASGVAGLAHDPLGRAGHFVQGLSQSLFETTRRAAREERDSSMIQALMGGGDRGGDGGGGGGGGGGLLGGGGGGGGGGGSGIVGALSKLSPVIKGIALAAAAVGGVVVGVNALVNTYQDVLPSLLEFGGNIGTFADDVTKQSLKFASSMEVASKSATQFGYRMEDALGVAKALVVGGAATTYDSRTVDSILEMSRYTGTDPGTLTAYETLRSRFGLTSGFPRVNGTTSGGGRIDELGRALSAFQQAGNKAPGRFGEFMSGITGIMGEGIGRGANINIGDIMALQVALGQRGEKFLGAQGFQVARTLNQSAVSATGLQSDKDIMLYRAASSLQDGRGDYLSTMKTLEKGMTVELFDATIKSIKSMTTDKVRQEGLVREVFGVGFQTAEDLLGGQQGTAYNRFKTATYNVEESQEIKLLNLQESIATDVKLIAAKFVGAKVWGLSKIEGITSFLAGSAAADRDRILLDEEYRGAIAPLAGVGHTEAGNSPAATAFQSAVALLAEGTLAGDTHGSLLKITAYQNALRAASAEDSPGGGSYTEKEYAMLAKSLVETLQTQASERQNEAFTVGVTETIKLLKEAFKDLRIEFEVGTRYGGPRSVGAQE